MKTSFVFEFLKAAKQGPRFFFAPLLGAINGFRDAVRQAMSEPDGRVIKNSYSKEFEMRNDTHHRDEIREAIFRSSTWLPDESQEIELLRSWEAGGRIFSVEYKGRRYYAAYQFDVDGTPLPIIGEVLLRLHSKNPWRIAAWFHFPSSWICDDAGPVAPKNAVSRSAEILKAANQAGGTYIA